MESVTATDAARNFSDLLNRVAYRRETLVISRGGRAVARLSPALPLDGVKLADLDKLLAGLPGLGQDAAAFAADVEDAELPPETDAWAS